MATRKTRLGSALLAVLMVVAMLASFVMPMSAETSYPSVTTVTATADGTDYSIANATEWMYVFNNLSWFNKDGLTLHLSGNVDFAGATNFTGFANPMFNFDGHGFKISNWGTETAPVSTPGMFAPGYNGNSGMDFIKNVTLENCYATASKSECVALVYSVGHTNGGTGNRPANFTMDNVHVKNSSFTAMGGQVHGILVARYTNGTESGTITFNNCSVIGTTFDVTAAGEHNGLVIGKPRGNNTAGTTCVYDITDLKLVGNTIKGANQGTGLIFGTIEDGRTTVNLKNAMVIDNVINAKEDVGLGLLGSSVDGKLNIQDSIIQDTSAAGTNLGVYMLGNGYGSNPQLNTLSNVFSNANVSLVEGKGTAFAVEADSSKLIEMAYNVNKLGYANKWTIAGNKVDGEGKGALPLKVTLTCESGSDQIIYALEGQTIALNYAEGASYSIVGLTNGASVNGNQLTLAGEDLTVAVTLVGLNYADLDMAVAAFNGKNTAYYASGTYEQSLADLLAEIAAKREGETFADQDEVGAYIAKLKTYALSATYPNLPLASEADTYTDSKNFLVNSLAELEYVANNPAKFGLTKTIHIGADITVTAGSKANRLTGVHADINGHGNAIKGVAFDGNATNLSAWIDTYNGTYIGNLVLDGWKLTNLGWKGSALIGYATGASSLTIENITVKNCTMDKASNYGSFTIGDCDTGSLTLKNITMTDNTFTRNAGTGNSGLLLGRYNKGNGTLTVEDIFLTRNTMNGTLTNGTYSSGAGVVIGEVTAANATVKNVLVTKSVYGEGHAVNGLLFGRVKGASPVVTNVIIEAGAWADVPVVRLQKTDNKHDANNAATVTLANVYSDAANMTYGDTTSAGANVIAEDIHNGYLAYALNMAGYNYVINENGLAFGTEGKPVQVTLHIGEDPYAVLFTDVNGKPIGLTEEMINAAAWEIDLATATFTEYTDVYGVLEPEFVLIGVEGKNGETVPVGVEVKKNPGFVGAEFKVTYDATALKLVGLLEGDVTVLPVLGDPVVEDGVATVEIALVAMEGDMPTDVTGDVLLSILQFEILDAAKPGAYDVTVEAIEVVNKAEDVIDVASGIGEVTVECNFRLVAPSNETAPNEAKHHYACPCGETKDEALCSESEGWTYEEVESSCDENGHISAHCAVCGYTYYAFLDLIDHEMIYHEATDPECEVDGNIEYWYCETCGSYFLDENGEFMTSEQSVVLPMLGHAYPDRWSNIQGTNTHEKVCANGCGEDLVEDCTFGDWVVDGDIKTKTCTECGNTVTASALSVNLTASVEEVQVGEIATVEVGVENVENLAGAALTVTYDPAAMNFAGTTIDGYADIGPEVNNDDGTVSRKIVFVLTEVATEDGTIAVLYFDMLEEGAYSVEIEGIASAYDLTEYELVGTEVELVATKPDYLAGDINSDGRVSIADAVMMMRVAAGDTEVLEKANLDAGNVTTEGDTPELVIKTNDIIMVLQYLNKTIEKL